MISGIPERGCKPIAAPPNTRSRWAVEDQPLPSTGCDRHIACWPSASNAAQMLPAPAPPAVIDLLRLAGASLPPTAADRELTPFVERIARGVDADGGFLLDMP